MAKKRFIDLDLDFQSHPSTGDVGKRLDDEAIKRSVRNIVFTNTYDRPFHPEMSSGVRALLFENVTLPSDL